MQKRFEKSINFCNFPKFKEFHRNLAYAMLVRLLWSIYTQILKKKFGLIFEKILKMSYELHIKYPQKLKYFFQIAKALREAKLAAEYQFS